MKKYVVALALQLGCLVVSAETFTVGSLSFQSISDSECEVAPSVNSSGNIVVPSKVVSGGVEYTVVAVGDNAFAGCDGIVSVSLPRSVVSLGRYAFYGCTALGSFRGEGVESIGSSAFSGCSGLNSPVFGRISDVGDSGFRNCTSLRSFSFGAGARIGTNVFSGCSGLESVVLPEGIDAIPDYTFNGCSALREVSDIDNVVRIGDYAFYTCSSLPSYSFGPMLESIGRGAFGLCSSLGEITINGIDTVIGDYAFTGCFSLATVSLEGVSELGEEAFANASGISEVRFDAGMHRIRERAFRNCNLISKIESGASQPPFLAASAFSDAVYAGACLTVPEGCVLLYRQVPPWSYFVNVVEKEISYVTVTETDVAPVLSCDGNILTISGGAGCLSVFDLSGKILFEDEGFVGAATTVSLPSEGIYLVCINGSTRKIFCGR